MTERMVNCSVEFYDGDSKFKAVTLQIPERWTHDHPQTMKTLIANKLSDQYDVNSVRTLFFLGKTLRFNKSGIQV